jgi:redox-sensitive bicupin YhaK (pirin superfamily)
VFVSRLNPDVDVAHELGAGRGVYLYVIEGDADVVGERMATGDAAEIWDEPSIPIRANATTELILVDVALS